MENSINSFFTEVPITNKWTDFYVIGASIIKQLTLVINFMSSKDTDKKRVMHLKRSNIEVIIKNKADEVMQEVFESRLFKYQTGLEESMEDSNFVLDYVDLLYCKCHKTNPNCCGSEYITSPDWLKNKKRSNKPHQ